MLRQLGNTDLQISALGLGTVKFGRNQAVKYPAPFTIPEDDVLLELLSICQDNQINFLDTAPAYGNSESRLGKLLKNQRHQWILCTKAGEHFTEGQSTYDFRPAAIRASVIQSLQKLNTDYLDLVLIHSDGNDEIIIHDFEVFDTLEQLKRQGHIRYYGMSTKTITGGKLTVDHSDVAMVTYNPGHTEEKPVLDYALQNNKGILIKKALDSGHLTQKAEQSPLEFVLQQPAVTSAIVGTINPGHLIENIQAMKHSLQQK